MNSVHSDCVASARTSNLASCCFRTRFFRHAACSQSTTAPQSDAEALCGPKHLQYLNILSKLSKLRFFHEYHSNNLGRLAMHLAKNQVWHCLRNPLGLVLPRDVEPHSDTSPSDRRPAIELPHACNLSSGHSKLGGYGVRDAATASETNWKTEHWECKLQTSEEVNSFQGNYIDTGTSFFLKQNAIPDAVAPDCMRRHVQNAVAFGIYIQYLSMVFLDSGSRFCMLCLKVLSAMARYSQISISNSTEARQEIVQKFRVTRAQHSRGEKGTEAEDRWGDEEAKRRNPQLFTSPLLVFLFCLPLPVFCDEYVPASINTFKTWGQLLAAPKHPQHA